MLLYGMFEYILLLYYYHLLFIDGLLFYYMKLTSKTLFPIVVVFFVFLFCFFLAPITKCIGWNIIYQTGNKFY